MSKHSLSIVLIALFITALNSNDVKAQCNSGELVENCIENLDSSFHFLKSYELDGMEGDNSMIEHSYVLTRNTDYLIKLCSEVESEMDIAIDIYDSNRKKVATSLIDSTYKASLEFACRVTGIYYLQYSFIESKTYCGGTAIGFKSD